MILEDLLGIISDEFPDAKQTLIFDSLKEALIDFNETPPNTDFAETDIPSIIVPALQMGARYFLCLKLANYFSDQPEISAQTPYVSRAGLTNKYLNLANQYLETYRKMKAVLKKKYTSYTLVYRQKKWGIPLPPEIETKYGIDE